MTPTGLGTGSTATIPDVDRVRLDTSVLPAAADSRRADHEYARASLDVWPASGIALYTSAQILREYLAVATRATGENGLGMERPAAVANVSALRARLSLLDEDAKVVARLLTLVSDVPCSGRQVHDANVVATAVTPGVGVVATSDTGHFARFREHVCVIGL